MNSTIGSLHKMSVVLQNPIEYHLRLGDEKILLNPWLNQTIQLRYTGEIHCIQCQRKTSKSFQQGYCYPCYRRLLECNMCTIHPEKCRFYENVCKADDWAHAHCSQPHVVYLANSSGLKVGITRVSHIPSRWIDQGATQGLIIFKVQNRHQAGLVEVALKAFVADKTNWQAMLKADNGALDLVALRNILLSQAQPVIDELIRRFPGEIQAVVEEPVVVIQYPVLQHPTKIKTLDFDKTPLVAGILQGIKGQYLLLDTGVISLRKFGGYQVEFGGV